MMAVENQPAVRDGFLGMDDVRSCQHAEIDRPGEDPSKLCGQGEPLHDSERPAANRKDGDVDVTVGPQSPRSRRPKNVGGIDCGVMCEHLANLGEDPAAKRIGSHVGIMGPRRLDGFATSRSRHAGGVNVLFCDGRVQFIDDSIESRTTPGDYGTWQRLAWIDDGQAATPP